MCVMSELVQECGRYYILWHSLIFKKGVYGNSRYRHSVSLARSRNNAPKTSPTFSAESNQNEVWDVNVIKVLCVQAHQQFSQPVVVSHVTTIPYAVSYYYLKEL
jgi:hypothetical protein